MPPNDTAVPKMNDQDRSRELHTQRSHLRDLSACLQIANVKNVLLKDKPDDEFSIRCRSIAERAGMDPDLVKSHASRSKNGFKTTLTAVNAHDRKIRMDIAKIPASLEKAIGYLLSVIDEYANEPPARHFAALALRDNLPADFSSSVFQAWLKERDYHSSIQTHFMGHVFWTTRNHDEADEAIGRAALADALQLGGFESATNEALEGIADALQSIGIQPGNVSILSTFWRASCYRSIRNRLASQLGIAAHALQRTQNSDGAFVDDADPLPIFRTALATAGIARLSLGEAQSESVARACGWLLGQQRADGGWATSIKERSSDPFVTTVVMDALLASNHQPGRNALERARNFLLESQQSEGWWKSKLNDQVATTTAVVVTCSRALRSTGDTSLEKSAYRFLTIAERLLYDPIGGTEQIALAAVYHGLEHLLYAVLSTPQYNTKIMDGDSTIGFRKALSSLQSSLQNQKLLKPGENVPERSSIDQLAYWRDQIIHKAASVDRQKAIELIQAVRNFTNYISQNVHPLHWTG